MRVASLVLLTITAGCTAPASGNQDDTYETLHRAKPAVRLVGDHGLKPYEYGGGNDAIIDARGAVFNVANSKNGNPTQASPCRAGTLPTNPYPLNIVGREGVTLAGGIVRSRVPQSSDWQASYCNSAAILLKRSANGVIDGVRITGAWDGIRASTQSAGLTLKNSWISDVRDDFFENDYLYPVAIYDSLVDGTFQGLSLKSSGQKVDASASIVTISGLLIRIREYPYKGELRYGALTKNDLRSPRLNIRNSVIAVDYQGGKTFTDYWERTWAKLADSTNNMFLWLSDRPIPATFPMPPKSFRVLTGRTAREFWLNAKANWVNCHPKVARETADARSDPKSCRHDSWGGYPD